MIIVIVLVISLIMGPLMESLDTQHLGLFIATRGMPKERDMPYPKGISDLIIRDKSSFKQKNSYL